MAADVSVLVRVTSKELENLLNGKTTALLRDGFPNRIHRIRYPADIYLVLEKTKGAVFAKARLTFAMICAGEALQLRAADVSKEEFDKLFAKKLNCSRLPVLWTIEDIEPVNLNIEEFISASSFKRIVKTPAKWTYGIRLSF